MSLDRFSTLLTLVPDATATSYIVTVGPRWAATTRASTPKVESVWPRASMMFFSSVPSFVEGGAVRSRSSGGRLVWTVGGRHRAATGTPRARGVGGLVGAGVRAVAGVAVRAQRGKVERADGTRLGQHDRPVR